MFSFTVRDSGHTGSRRLAMTVIVVLLPLCTLSCEDSSSVPGDNVVADSRDADADHDVTDVDADPDQDDDSGTICDDLNQREIDGVCSQVPNLSMLVARFESPDSITSYVQACTRSENHERGPEPVLAVIEERRTDNCWIELVDTTVDVEEPTQTPPDEPLPMGSITFGGAGLIEPIAFVEDERDGRCHTVRSSDEELFREGLVEVDVGGSDIFPGLSLSVEAPGTVSFTPQDAFVPGEPYTITWSGEDVGRDLIFAVFANNADETRRATALCEGEPGSGQLTIPGEITALVPDDGRFEILGHRSITIRVEPPERDVVVFLTTTSHTSHVEPGE